MPLVRPPTRPVPLLGALLVALAAACGGEAAAPPEGQTDEAATAGTVEAAVHTRCSTLAVRGLSEQLVAEIACIAPGSLASIEALDGVTLDDEVFPYLQQSAATALAKAARASKTTIEIKSALRTTPQQFLLRRWYETKRCGIDLAAPVGASNHEQGLAVDAMGGRSRALVAAGFHWFGSGDAVHHDFSAGGDVDLTGLSTKAFQRLWNRNHPDQPLPEDGTYSRATELRLKQAPATGFDLGASCAPEGPPDAGP